MTRSGSNTGTMLSWVREDLDKHMDQLRRQLEHLAGMSNPSKESIGETSGVLDQLRLSFEALNFPGAATVTEEMILVCEKLRRHRVDNINKAYGGLMDAMVILPSYLDRLQSGHRDLPVLLLPIINTLRNARHDNRLQASSMFTPDLEVELPDLERPDEASGADEPFAEFAARLRGQYENAMLNWMQEPDSSDLLSPLQGICEMLMHRVQRNDLRRMWWVASELVGGLADGYAQNDPHMRRLFARLHLVLKKLSDGGEDAVEETSANALTRDLLYQAAGARRGNPGIEGLRKQFKLNDFITDQDDLARAQGSVKGQSREMYLSLGAAVQDELSLVKDALDLELRTGQVDQERREQSRDALERLLDTLKMLGLAGPAGSLEDLLPAFEESADANDETREAALLSLAQQLLLVESAVREQVETLGEPLKEETEAGFIDLPAHEQRRVVNRLLDETVTSVYQFQEAIKSRFSGSREISLSTPLEEVAGALELLGDTEAAELVLRLIDTTAAVLKDAMSEAVIPAWQLELFTDAVAALELYLAACRDQQDNRERFVAILRERLDMLEGGEQPVEQPVALEPSEPVVQEPADEPRATEDATQTWEPTELDPELLGVFLEEYDAVSEALQEHLPEWIARLDDVNALTEVRRSFHTLKGSGRMVGAFELGEFAWRIEELLNALLDTRIDSFADAAVTVRLAQAALPALKQRLMQQPAGLDAEVIEAIAKHAERLARSAQCDWENLRTRLPGFLASMLPDSAAAEPEAAGTPDGLDSRIHEELGANLAHIQALLEAISGDRQTRASEDQVRAAHAIAGVLAMKPDGREAEIAQALEALLAAQSSSGTAFTAEAIWALGSSLGHLQARLERLEGHQEATAPGDEQELIDQLTAIAAQMKTEQAAAMSPAAVAEEEEPESQPAGPDITDEWSALDRDIIAIFMEEAREVLARCDSLLHEWHDGLDGFDIVQNLQREIHTFKGGARMAGLEALGNLSHAMESLLERIAGRELPLSKPAVRALENGCDRLNDWLDAIARGERPDDAAETLAFFEDQAKMLDGVPAGLASPLESEPANFDIPAPEMEAAAKAGAEEPEVEAVTPEPEARDIEAIPEETETPVERAGDGAAQSHMRVEAELLDSLVNSASEINILRSRLERQISNIRSNLGEFDATLGRLREQFRKLEIETETQIRSRYQDTGEEGTEGFDPLELDRFSSMQQLSRGLSESVADLLNLQELLDDSARNSETLLTQQSRFSTELQEGLMQTRMVPFGSIAPRLRRLVRTATRETGKNCRLKLQMAGGSDQLDRNVLERITAPLEHMLRNAIAHGIEKPSERKKAGKPAEGEISITVESEATEFVLRIEDDGAGINLDAIRQRAASQGLIAADADPPAHQLFEFMLQSGFSTSTTVTGLAGRGIGLDVVSSEIKQIGGSLEIASEEGRGTSFTIRIPFTLAVMQAIGVVAGENRYLIPLASVAGVARMLPAEYLELAGHEEPVYEFAGNPYPLLDLEPLLGEPSHPIGNDKVSLLIVRAGNQRAAFRIPQLTGHREIVIKPVGPQISSVPGILGGTVTGDGQVVVILDPGPLIRHALLHGARVEPAVPVVDHQARPNLAMVVDDSITMRKVTSRVLQGQGFEVITARDGVDATEQLQERVPDLLLLDIEMPRMDGYGVAEFVRADARLRHIPIMMITSRSGQKHRDRAKQAGANAYLTKPYKEAELLAEVGRLLDKESEAHGP